MNWFAPPEQIESRVFTALSARFRATRRNAWADSNRGGMEIHSFLEGPSFDRAGNLYVTDIPFGRVFRIDRGGEWTLVAEYDGWPNGLKITREGTILITDYRRGLLRLDPDCGAVEPICADVRSESFKGLNDLIIADNGDVFFTDQGQTGMQDPTGRVYRRTAGGALHRLLDTCPSPNGIALDPTGRWLFVALTRACQVWRLPVSADAVTGKVNVFAHMPGGRSGPDGLAADVDGGLAVANPGHGCVWVLSARGEPRYRVMSCAGEIVTNLAYDPADPHRLVFTESESGQILEARLPVAGLPLVSHA